MCPVRPPRPVAGFSVIEMLAAVTIFSILVALVAVVVDNTAKVIARSAKLQDADGEARAVFDRMQADVFAMARRPDLDVVLAKPAGNDALFLFSSAPAYYDTGNASLFPAASQPDPKSRLSLVGYRVNSTDNPGALERLGLGLTWDGGAADPVVFLSYAADGTIDALSTIPGAWPGYVGHAPSYADGSGTPWQPLGPQVFRLETCFLLADGTLSLTPATGPAGVRNNLGAAVPPKRTDDTGSGYRPGSRWFDGTRGYVCTDGTAGAAVWLPLGTRDLRAIVVSIAVLDARSAKLVPAANLPNVAAQLPDAEAGDLAASPPTLPQQKWQVVLQQTGFAASAGIPAEAASAIRVYQRYLYLDNP